MWQLRTDSDMDMHIIKSHAGFVESITLVGGGGEAGGASRGGRRKKRK